MYELSTASFRATNIRSFEWAAEKNLPTFLSAFKASNRCHCIKAQSYVNNARDHRVEKKKKKYAKNPFEWGKIIFHGEKKGVAFVRLTPFS